MNDFYNFGGVMILGIFVRHYKIYRNINFIPISNGVNFSAFIGPNGVGKSSVLDALDKFFNGGDWSINLHAKAEGGLRSDDKLPYIVPVFALKKDDAKGMDVEVIESISEYLWTTKIKTVDALNDFYKFRDNLHVNGISKDSHYIVAVGRRHNQQESYFSSFDNDILTAIESIDKSRKDLDGLLSKIIERYAYFYIPVEADAIQFSKLESNHVQKLLDEDIKLKIQEAIGRSTIQSINSSLQEFINQVSESLKDYQYKGTFKDRLTMNDLIEKVFEAYFSIKILHKKSQQSTIPIRELSAGEKRAALIDLAYSLLARNKNRSHHVILAIDEPDASLHSSACHDHFSRLAEIPNLTEPKTQVLITTHWYGFLPVVQNGVVHSISEREDRNRIPEFFSFDLYNFREQIKQAVTKTKGEYPRDIELKSYNDMLQSIVSSIVKEPSYNWILCEGVSDKIYLEYYLRDMVKNNNLRIVPLGGFKAVRRSYEYLKVPLSDPEYKISGKVLCLVDTDSQLERVDLRPESKCIDFKRIVFDESSNDVVLVKVDNQIVSPATEIEQSLNGGVFVDVVKGLSDSFGGSVIKDISSKADVFHDGKVVLSYLNLTPLDNRKMMKEYFDIGNNKVVFARSYVERASGSDVPSWVGSVRDYFL